ncbi:hypothetical protein ACMBCN_01970, partial [Candidatus Liberibacter asiaticus]|nr:hypothetical protein [Candidatus Liberibacter asiaticus]
HLKKSLKNRHTMINLESFKENSKGKEIEISIEIEQKGIKIPKIEMRKLVVTIQNIVKTQKRKNQLGI